MQSTCRLHADYMQSTCYIQLFFHPCSKTLVPAPRDRITPSNLSATYDINPPADIPPSHTSSSDVASSFYGWPPIWLEFLAFNDSCETAGLLNFIEQCENFLDQTSSQCGACENVEHSPEMARPELVEGKKKQSQRLSIFQRELYGCFFARWLPVEFITN